VGSIEPGKDADLAIFDKHPLSNYAKVEKVFIDGELYFDREKDLEERPGKEARKKALIDKEKAQEKKERKKPEPAEDKKSEEPGGVQ
jgi:adenine deaminase